MPDMPKCFLKRVVPFALALLVGVTAASLLGSRGPRARKWQGHWREENRSRTWLVIRSMPAAKYAKEGGPMCEGCSVRMRVMFGTDGTVSGNEFQLGPSSYPLIEDATTAARSITFTPATWNGRPIPVWADVTYACGHEFPNYTTEVYTCRLWIDKDSLWTGRGRPWRVITSP